MSSSAARRLLRGPLGGALHGVLLVAIAYCAVQAHREDRLFERLVSATLTPGMSQAEQGLALMHATHQLMHPRIEQFPTSLLEPLDRVGPQPLSTFLIEGGACGAHSRVLARALQIAGIDARIAQLRVNGVWGAHIVVAASIDGRWVALDPLLDAAFVDEDGRLAAIDEVGRDWERYVLQLEESRRPLVSYESIRFTNWDKVPVLLPALRGVLRLTVGEEAAADFSLRSHLLNVWRIYAVLFGLTWLGLAFLTLLSPDRRRERR